MTEAQRTRKINKLSHIRIELSGEANNKRLNSSERVAIARAADALTAAIEVLTAA